MCLRCEYTCTDPCLLGLSRTGTSSLREALIDLGYFDVYHFAAVLQENPRDAEIWNEGLDWKEGKGGRKFTKEDFDAVLGHCMVSQNDLCNLLFS